jgi:hypothetical protein
MLPIAAAGRFPMSRSDVFLRRFTALSRPEPVSLVVNVGCGGSKALATTLAKNSKY